MAIIKLTNQNANIITGGTVATARLGSGTANNTTFLRGDQSYQALSEFNDDKLVNDISTLALHQATNNNSAKYNLANSNVDVYQDASAIANLTNCARDSSGEYISTVYTAQDEFTNDSNTILLMHFNGDLTDSSSNNMGGQFTLSNMDSNNFVTSDYKFGSHSLLFNGTDEHVYSSNLNDHDSSVAFPTTGDFTIEHWFKYDSTSNSNTERIMSIGNSQNSPSGGSTPGLSWGYSGGSTTQWNTYGDYSNNYNWGQNSFGTQDTTTWHHIAYVRKSGTLYSFLDGVYKGNDNFYNGNNMNSTGIIFFSNRSGGNNEWFGGKIDEVRISDTDRYDVTQSAGTQVFTPNQVTANNATGSYESTAQTSNASVSKISAVVTYTNATGTNTLNTDIVLQVSANNGTNWSNATLTAAGTFSTGVLQAVTNDISVTAGTQLKYKISFANQASGSKVARINGVSLSY